MVATQLAAEFDVSEDAIRRDLRALAAEGLCRRVYGGALPLVPGSTPMEVRVGEGRAEKAVLAQAAVGLIGQREVIFLDSGSGNLALAECLPEDFDLTVATNSIAIAAALAGRSDIRLIVIGGTVNPIVGGCVDAAAVQAVGLLNIDRCFLGACGVSADDGISAYERDDALFKGALVAASRDCLVLATADKLGQRAPYRVAGIERLTAVIVAGDATDAAVSALAIAGPRLIRAPSPQREDA